MRISDWSSDVCSSDLIEIAHRIEQQPRRDTVNALALEKLARKPCRIIARDGVEFVDHPLEEGSALLPLGQPRHPHTAHTHPLRRKHSVRHVMQRTARTYREAHTAVEKVGRTWGREKGSEK